MRVAVVTDTISSGYFFSAWHRYYAAQFGPENICIFTYREHEEQFSNFILGGVKVIPETYDDDLRISAISEFVSDLLRSHDVVVRVDVDEFLIPDPNKYISLAEYISKWPGTHITAFGFDVLQSPEEPDLDLSKSIMSQRRYAYALTPMNKTCVTRIGIKWGRGFHYCSKPPQFDHLFLLHTKRADIKLQKDWNDHMRQKAGDNEFVRNYYSWEHEKITNYHKNRLSLPTLEGEDVMSREEFNRTFLGKIKYNERNELYEGPYEFEQVNVIVPPRFRTFF